MKTLPLIQIYPWKNTPAGPTMYNVRVQNLEAHRDPAEFRGRMQSL